VRGIDDYANLTIFSKLSLLKIILNKSVNGLNILWSGKIAQAQDG
jgi:hypothetical protein